MRIITVAVGKTFNDGNFESTRIDMSAELEAGEDEKDVVCELSKIVKRCYKSQQ